MEQEIWVQKAKATIILNQLIKWKSCKQLCQHFWQNPLNPNYKQRNFTSLISPTTFSSSFQYPKPEPSPPPLLILPPLGTWLNPIVIDDNSDEKFLMRESRSRWVARVVDDQDELSDMILNCQMCGSMIDLTYKCRTSDEHGFPMGKLMVTHTHTHKIPHPQAWVWESHIHGCGYTWDPWVEKPMWVCIVGSVENCSNNLEYRYMCSTNVAHSVLGYVWSKK